MTLTEIKELAIDLLFCYCWSLMTQEEFEASEKREETHE